MSKMSWKRKLTLRVSWILLAILCLETARMSVYSFNKASDKTETLMMERITVTSLFDIEDIPCPSYHSTNTTSAYNRSIIADVVLVGSSSPIVYNVARRLLREGHRVTILQHHELDWPMPRPLHVIHGLQDDLKCDYPDTYILVPGLSCDLKTSRTGRRDRHRAKLPYTHVVFIPSSSQHASLASPETLLEHGSRCLADVLESSAKQDSPTPVRFTLLVQDQQVVSPHQERDDCASTSPLGLRDALTTEQLMATFTYRSLYGLQVRVLRLPSDLREQLASPLIDEEIAIYVVDATFSPLPCVYARLRPRADSIQQLNSLVASGRLQLLRSSDSLHPLALHSRDLLMTSYFTSKKDPQRSSSVPNTDNKEYVERWHDTATKLGMSGVIFHDGLSEQFQRSVNASLMAFELVTLGRRSTNDERYFHYLEYLEQHPDIRYGLLTDVSDVTFSRDPFHLMRALDVRQGARLYVGEDDLRWTMVGESGWVMSILRRCYGRDVDTIPGDLKSMSKHSIFLNAGVIGGHREILLRFLRQLTAVMRTASGGINCNMASVNYVAHKYFADELFVGFPLTSDFKTYDKLYEGYIVHK